MARLKALRAARSAAGVKAALAALSECAKTGSGNLLDLTVQAMRLRATVGEVSDALEAAWGRHRADTQKVSGVYAAAYDSAEGWEQLKREIAAFAEEEGRRPRVMIAKLGQDGHDRGAKVVASAFADLGFDVDIGPLFQTAEECARQAIENDVHAVGVSTLAAGHMTLVPAIIESLKAQGGGDIVVFVGGVIPAQDYAFLYERRRQGHLRARHADPGERQGRPRADSPGGRRALNGGATMAALPAADQTLCDDVAAASGERQRRAVAKAITLLESTRADHRLRADALLAALPVPAEPALRVGISGVPGVGKSTFIETLGLELIAKGHRVAVLAVDPSSSLSGGSILGDKTRMERLSVHERAFVRPSPSGGTLGGVAAATREAIRVVEAAGHDVVIVETVGVGQSEAAVAGMTDLFLLMQLPNAGDDLQAIKKGVLELADLVVVNKADLDPAAAARAVGQLESAMQLSHSREGETARPRVLATSAIDPPQVRAVWDAAAAWAAERRASGAIARRRQTQARAWLQERIDAGLAERFRAHPAVRRPLAGDARRGRRRPAAGLGRRPDAAARFRRRAGRGQ